MNIGKKALEEAKKRILKKRLETGQGNAPGAVVVEEDLPSPKLYACEWCGELFEATLFPQSCPQCGRIYTDYVEELDTGRIYGGRFVIREATGSESNAYFRLREKGERKRIRTDVARTED
ncbi:MAG: hypothetical protein IJV40_12620 [Oscillospiraceae bacterium]|nr:hypothetical protein [Oscillospiraceae bacterium]